MGPTDTQDPEELTMSSKPVDTSALQEALKKKRQKQFQEIVSTIGDATAPNASGTQQMQMGDLAIPTVDTMNQYQQQRAEKAAQEQPVVGSSSTLLSGLLKKKRDEEAAAKAAAKAGMAGEDSSPLRDLSSLRGLGG